MGANPYIKRGNPPTTTQSVTAFLDILGFATNLRRAYKERTSDNLLIRLRSALDQAYAAFNNELSGLPSLPVDIWEVKAFTDNIVIGCPVFHGDGGDAEGDLGSVLLATREYQLAMVNAGFFVRGAVSIGELYLDDQIVFGDSLIEAYDGETLTARDPRIVMCPSVLPYIERHVQYWGHPSEAPHNQVLLKDPDGQLFVNYLGCTFDDDPENPRFDELKLHKDAVETKLDEYRNQPPLWSKYAWVANYHNFICQEQGGRFLEFRIVPGKLRSHPSRIYLSPDPAQPRRD